MDRISCTLPPDLVSQLDTLAGVIGCSRSSLISLMLSENISVIEKLCFNIRDVNSQDVIVKRASGQSLAKIEERYREILDGFEMYQ
jgi:metal-responsive CopG/Arc/MetJ family transcriptional regulator